MQGSLCNDLEFTLEGDDSKLHQPPAVVPCSIGFGVLLQGRLCQLQFCLDCRIRCLRPMLSLQAHTEALRRHADRSMFAHPYMMYR